MKKNKRQNIACVKCVDVDLVVISRNRNAYYNNAEFRLRFIRSVRGSFSLSQQCVCVLRANVEHFYIYVGVLVISA